LFPPSKNDLKKDPKDRKFAGYMEGDQALRSG